MNDDKVIELAKKCGVLNIEDDSTYSVFEAVFFRDDLVALANACEKIGMEKAAKICDEWNDGNDLTANELAETIRSPT